MSNGHAVPIPTYDINGKLITPDRYKIVLAGAITGIGRVTSMLTHWFIDSDSKDRVIVY